MKITMKSTSRRKRPERFLNGEKGAHLEWITALRTLERGFPALSPGTATSHTWLFHT